MTFEDDLAAALADVLADATGTRPSEITDLRRLTGGASRQTWSFAADGERLVLQQERVGTVREGMMSMEAALLRAATDAGVPVPSLVAASGEPGPLGTGFLLSRFVDGETIARKLLRDDAYATARQTLAADCGRALAAIHAIDYSSVPNLPATDPVTEFRERLDAIGDPHPTFEHAFRWIEANRPAAVGRALVHGDFRLGNLIIGPDGLRAVIDWEIAHVGDPMEDLGWLCTRAWRFGGPGPVGGFGSYEDLFRAYEEVSGIPVDGEVVRWWEVLSTLKWGIVCMMQARSHLNGTERSMELASIGRRVCENEHDLLLLLEPEALAAATARPDPEETRTRSLHGRPTAAELVEAIGEWVAGDVRSSSSSRVAFHSRVAENLTKMLGRELQFGPSMNVEHAKRLAALGVVDDDAFAAGVRDGSLVGASVVTAMAESVVDKVRVANPRWLIAPAT